MSITAEVQAVKGLILSTEQWVGQEDFFPLQINYLLVLEANDVQKDTFDI
jgi:hypothetical protein